MKKRDYAVSLVFFFCFWFAFLSLSGALTAGFHFTDDHQIIYYNSVIGEAGAAKTISGWVYGDMTSSGRFTPLYLSQRILQIAVFGADFFKWAVYDGVMASLSCFILSAFMGVIGFTLIEALLLPLLLYLGFQTAVWWRFGTAETTGMLLLSLLLLFTALSVKKRSGVYDAAIIVSGVLLTLTKENLILIVPAVLFLILWLEVRENGLGWMASLKKRIVPVAVLLGVSFAEILFIKFFVGTTGIGYAGYEGFKPGPFVKALVNFAYAGQAWLVMTGAALAFVTRPSGKGIIKELVPPVVFSLLVIVPQALIYAKSGVSERYLLPGLLASSFLTVHLLKAVRENLASEDSGARELGPKRIIGLALIVLFLMEGLLMMKSAKFSLNFTSGNLELLSGMRDVPLAAFVSAGVNQLSKSLVPAFAAAFLIITAIVSMKGAGGRLQKVFNYRVFFAATVLWAVSFNATVAFDQSYLSAFQGAATNEWLASIKGNTAEDGIIVVAADPALHNEWALSLKRYLNIESKRNNLYAYPVLTKPSYTGFETNFMKTFPSIYGKGVEDIPEGGRISAVVIFPGAEAEFLKNASAWFNPYPYSRYANEYGFVSYYYRGGN